MIRLLLSLCLLFSLSAQAATPVVVSSKIDTEGSLLGNMIVQRLKQAGLDVENRVQLGGTPIVRKAIISGEIDIYPEYTGNAAFFFNQAKDPVWKSFKAGYEKAKALDYKANHIVWLTPANANNTWAIAVRKKVADSNHLATMTDFGRFVRQGGKIKLAASAEFVSSQAALPAFQKVYDFDFKQSQLLVLSGGNTAATIKAAALGTDGTNAAMVYGTDGAISAVGLVVMTDDKGVQPVYAPTPIIREAVLKAHPQIAELLKPVFSSLSLETLQKLNARIAVGGENASTVAADYLKTLHLKN